MIDKADQRRLMEQYLFGELSADARAEFEGAYFKDNNIFYELVAFENEMIDRYVLGELSGAEREKFGRSFLSNPAGREKVETARSLLAYSAAAENAILARPFESKGKSRPSARIRTWAVQLAAAAVLFALIGGIFWLVLSNQRLGNELETLRREQTTSAQEKKAMQRQIESLRADLEERDSSLQQIAELQPHDRGTVSFTLGPGLSRGGDEVANLVISARASFLSLHMVIEHDSHSRYSLSLRTADGRLLWRRDNVRGRQIDGGNKEIAVTIPSRLLQNGDYSVRVSAGSENALHNLAGYGFHVIRR